nr:calcium-binding protein [Caballeronia sordidicola]
MEIVVDAYNEEECAMAWYCHLEEQLAFPFEARVRHAMAVSSLHPGENVSVIRLAHDELCRVSIFVWVRYNQQEILVLVNAGVNDVLELRAAIASRSLVLDHDIASNGLTRRRWIELLEWLDRQG